MALSDEAKSHSNCKIERFGNVTDTMDKSIGRSVIKIKGAVSANNYIDFSNISLEGNFLCVQLCMMKSNIATMHMELETTQGIPLRVTISTLYDTPRFLGRSLRLPLPVKSGWTNVLFDMNAMLRQHCPLRSTNGASTGKFKMIRRIQLCSNMVVRDIVTSNHPFSPNELPPKEIAVLASAAPQMAWIDVSSEGYFEAPSKLSVADITDKPTPLRADLVESSPAAATNIAENDSVLEHMTTGLRYQHHSHQHSHERIERVEHHTSVSRGTSNQSQQLAQTTTATARQAERNMSPSSGRAIQTSSPVSNTRKIPAFPVKQQPVTPQSRPRPLEPDTPDLIRMEPVAPQTVADDGKDSAIEHSRYKEKKTVPPSRSRLAISKVTPRRVGAAGISSSSSTAIVSTAHTHSTARHTHGAIPVTLPADRVVGLERCMDYRGGPAALLYNGDMIAMASGSVIVLLDVRAKDVSNPSSRDIGVQERGNIRKKERYSTGLWKAFKPSVVNAAYQAENYPQAYLKGHSSDVIIIEVSLDGRLMATCESGEKARMFLWDLQDGKRLAVLQPHAESVHSLCFSPESNMLCTTGWDHVRRVQIVVWDIPASSGPMSKPAGSTNNSLVISRQLSDFHISKIMFSPYQEDSLVSCGRENIRFWRMRKGHLPGRPVQLNEFSRGYLFTDLTYVNAPELGTDGSSGVLSPCVLVASSLGLLLRVDCAQEQVVCAYQLHNGPIRSLSVNGSYAVTGGDDCRMRIWPLHFTDFLMEAHHEAAVTHVFVAQDMRLLSVGTASGTLGILDVMDHRYWTVLRSHVDSVVCVAARPPLGDEFLSIGKDNTIRLWDTTTGQQKFEFDSPQDSPLCGAYHPVEHMLAVGFASGAVRIFEVQTTSTRHERTHRNPSPIASILYSQAKDFTTATELRLYALSLSGTLSVYDVGDNYTPIRSISVPPNPWEGIMARDIKTMRYTAMMQMSISKDGRLLATSCGSVNSLCVFDTAEMVTVYKGSAHQGRAASVSVPIPATDHSLLSVHQAMASSLRSHGSNAMSAASTAGLNRDSPPLLGHASTPIAGLVFCLDNDKNSFEDSNTLLIVTDKRVISMDIVVRNESLPSAPAVLESAYALNLSQDDISSRKLEGNVRPVPGSISRDHTTGLLFMAVKCDASKADEIMDSTTPYSKYIRPVTGDALAVVGCTVKKTRDPKTYRPSSRLSLTSMQILDDIPGDKSILSTSPCGPSSNRIVMADSGGGVSIYYMRDDRIMRLKDKGSPQQTAEVDDSLLDVGDEDAFHFDSDAVSPPAPADMYGMASIREEDQSVGRRDLEVDFADQEDTMQVQVQVQVNGRGERANERRTYMTTASMEAMFDDSPGATKERTTAWEEQSAGPIGTPPVTSTSVRWRDSEEKADSHLVVSSSNSTERKVISSTTTTTTTTTSRRTSDSRNAQQTAATSSKRTTTAVSMAAGRSTASSRNQKTDKKDPSLVIRRSGSSAADDSTKENMSSVPISPVPNNRSHDLNNSFGSDTELVKEQMRQSHFSSHSLAEGYESDGDSVDSEVGVDIREKLNASQRGTLTMECAFKGPLAPARVLSQKIKVTPSFCATTGSLLTCGGNELSVENVGSRSNYAILNIPPLDTAGTGDPLASQLSGLRRVVHMTSLSPSGLFAAAIVDVVCHDMKNVKALPPSELHVWTCQRLHAEVAGDVFDVEDGPGDVWRHIGTVALHRHAMAPVESDDHEFAASAGASLDWAHDDSLALLVPVPIPASKERDPLNDSAEMFDAGKQEGGALLSITKWKQDEYEEAPSLGDIWNTASRKVPHINMPGIPLILPFASGPDGMLMLREWDGEGDCACVVWGKGKIAVFAIHAPESDERYLPINPLWISDAGRSGPYLSVHVSQYSHLHTLHPNTGLMGAHSQGIGHASNAIATHRGHSFQETCVRPNHTENVDAPMPGRNIKSQVPKQSKTFTYDSARRTMDCKSCEADGIYSCECRTDTHYHTFPLLVALDSLGGIVCVRLSTYPDPPMKCIAKVSSSHVSGAPRTLALSPCGTVLIMGSSSSLQIFNVAVKDSPGHPFSVSLTLMQKVVVPFPLDFMRFSAAPDTDRQAVGMASRSKKEGCLPFMELVLASTAGDIGIFRSSPRSKSSQTMDDKKKKQGGHVDIYRSPVPFLRVSAIAASCESCSVDSKVHPPKLFTLDPSTAQLGVMDANMGVKIHSSLDARNMHSCVCIDTFDGLVAIGSKCGRVSLYAVSTMALLHVVALTSFTTHQHGHKQDQHHFRAGSKGLRSKEDIQSGNQSIRSVKFVSNGCFLVVLREDDALFVLPTKGTALPRGGNATGNARPVPLHLKASTTPYTVYPVHGDDRTFCVVRRHTAFLYTIDRRDDGAFHAVRIGSMRLSAMRFLDDKTGSSSSSDRSVGMTSRALVAAATKSCPIRIHALHVVREPLASSGIKKSQSFRVTAIGSLAQMGWDRTSGFLFGGSVDVNSVYESIEKGCHFDLQLFTCASLGSLGHSFSQNGSLLAGQCGNSVCVFNCSRLHDTLRVVRANALAVATEEHSAAEHAESSDDMNWRRAVGTKGSIVRTVFNHREMIRDACVGTFVVNSDAYTGHWSNQKWSGLYASIALQPKRDIDGDTSPQLLFVYTDSSHSPSVYQIVL